MTTGTTRIGVAGALLASAIWAIAWPGTAAAEDPHSEGPPAAAAKTVLVLPTRVPDADAASRATFDLLIATSLQELGFAVVDNEKTAAALDASTPDLAQARELYLGLRFPEALEAARAIRVDILSHHGDLLCDSRLTEAELLMVRTLLDLGELEEARSLAGAVLEREPGLRLDPVESPPAMQALWVAALEKRSGMQPKEQAADDLVAIGKAAGAAYAVAATAKRTPDGVGWLVLQIVPTAGPGGPSRHPMALGARGTWARAVRLKLEERFPPPPSEVAATPVVPVVPPGPTDGKKKVWYKSWWFWTGVGIVVVGGAVVGIAVGVDRSGGGNNGSIDAEF